MRLGWEKNGEQLLPRACLGRPTVREGGVGSFPAPRPAGDPVGREGAGQEGRGGSPPPAWGRRRVGHGGRGEGGAGHLSRGMEKSRKVATSSGVWLRASRVTACRMSSLAWGMRTEHSCKWMARPRLATFAGRQNMGERAGLRGEARPHPRSLREALFHPGVPG